MSWIFGSNKKKNAKRNYGGEQANSSGLLPQSLRDLLQLFDAENIVLGNGDVVLEHSAGVTTLNIIREQYLNNEFLLRLVRATRRSGKSQEVTMELPRGPIGAGTHDLLVRVSLLGEDGLIVILIFDDSEMRRLDAIRRDFVANISHELKTPIGALSILSEAVLGASDDPEAITRFATRMQTEASRLSELVQEIINLSRLQDDDPLKRAQPISISEAIKEAIDQSRLNAEARKVEIVYNNDDSAIVNGDRDQITMAIHNLVENAINYSPDATRVAIGVNEVDGICEISVSDQGIGIPEKDLERIFERFYRVDAARSRITGGTGLGLSIVKHVVTNHGGDISVWSVEGAGSTFTIRLPLVNDTNNLSNNLSNNAAEATK
jgi:two-component system sensor histidine kinase SenX3